MIRDYSTIILNFDRIAVFSYLKEWTSKNMPDLIQLSAGNEITGVHKLECFAFGFGPRPGTLIEIGQGGEHPKKP
jgi:hypothetical protein